MVKFNVVKVKIYLKKSIFYVAIIASLFAIITGLYSLAVMPVLKIEFTGDYYQTAEGFGASSAWSFQLLGAPENAAAADKAAELLYSSDNGLNLDIYRYNIGAGSMETRFDDVAPYNEKDFHKERRSESFFKSENYVNADSFKDPNNYDFTKDAYSMEMFKKSLAYGSIKKVVLFSNSPHYLMTESGKATGDYEYQNNLKAEFYDAYADYLLIIANGIKDIIASVTDSVTEIWISPINEPQWKWGGESASQEGCHYDPEEAAKFFDVFYNRTVEYNRLNGSEFKMDVFESGNYKKSGNVYEYIKAMEKYPYFDTLEAISVHSYGVVDKTAPKKKFYEFMSEKYPNIKISHSEFCEMAAGRDCSINSALVLANVIAKDLTYLNASDWSYWLAVSTYYYKDGLLYWDNDGSAPIIPKRYYAMAHFSKFITRGSVRTGIKTNDFINIGGVNLCAYKRPDGKLVAVIVNNGIVRKTRFSQKMNGTAFITDEHNDLLEKEVSGGELKLPANSITTVVFS